MLKTLVAVLAIFTELAFLAPIPWLLTQSLIMQSYEDLTPIRMICVILSAVLKHDVLACLQVNYAVTFGLSAYASLFSTVYPHLRELTLKYQSGPIRPLSGHSAVSVADPEPRKSISALLADFKSIELIRFRVPVLKFTSAELARTLTEALTALSSTGTVRHLAFDVIFMSDINAALPNFPFADIQDVVSRFKLLDRLSLTPTYAQETLVIRTDKFSALVREGLPDLEERGLLVLPDTWTDN
ncbi:hypothetical protein EUX98_g7707 [Antrodiella citrinella]|uniref:Uncharacterized protein n=1 Tax=Antrodiella citrinella TaxID=2447956 RepID=A0A4S4MLE9_9APHY|nr:hypothetical protein EUX98_g7707 [Antrodiella citrinella]